MKLYTKEILTQELVKIRDRGWFPTTHPGNDGGVGNTLENLLGIEENNLPIPNATEWELKCQRIGTSSLTTLFHSEPSPKAIKFVPNILLPQYGWKHKKAGDKYPNTEMSFRQTFNSQNRTDRGFMMKVDRRNNKILVSFDSGSVADRHGEWLENIRLAVGLGEINPQPYWGIDELFHKLGTKLFNCFFVLADSKKIDGVEHFQYVEIKILQGLSMNKFLFSLEEGAFYLDFDARTGHNHGTKLRMRRNWLPNLYDNVIDI